MGSETYHEPLELIREETKDMHRAIVSLIEELEAVDWYQQRADACNDRELAEVLIHHKNEEIEHALMNLEWIRRNNPEFDRQCRTYLFTEKPITEVEEEAEHPETASAGGVRGVRGDGSLGIGSLKPTVEED